MWGREGGCEEVWGNVWESVWGECGGCRKVCWDEGVGKCVGVWESYGSGRLELGELQSGELGSRELGSGGLGWEGWGWVS